MQPNFKKSNSEFYTIEDFYKVEKIDAHIHIYTFNNALQEQAVKDNFKLVNINVDAFDDISIEKQQEYSVEQNKNYPDDFFYLTTFRVKGFEQPGWTDSVLSYLKESFAKGAVGVKVWKNIGMLEKTKEGNDIFVDDPLFDPIFSYLEEIDKPLTGHIGEPKSCWLPIDEMIMPGDIDYFSKNPEFHIYLHPESPAYIVHVDSYSGMLKKHDNLFYVGAHLGSIEWSIDELAKKLDEFPNMTVDMAERICHLQYQSIQNYQKVYDFIIKYQDRLLYGTDIIIYETSNSAEEMKNAHEIWMRDWIYFTTDGLMTSPALNREFKGLRLPKSVVDKIYFKNAKQIYLSKK